MKQSQECFHMIVQIAWQNMGTWPKGSKIRSFVEMLRNLIRNHFCHLPFHARYALLNLSNMSQLDCSLYIEASLLVVQYNLLVVLFSLLVCLVNQRNVSAVGR